MQIPELLAQRKQCATPTITPTNRPKLWLIQFWCWNTNFYRNVLFLSIPIHWTKKKFATPTLTPTHRLYQR